MKGEDGAVVVRTVERRVKELCPGRSVLALPFVVWLADPTDERTTRRIEQSPLGFRNTGVALQRFRCLKVVVPNLPKCALKEHYRGQLGFRFFDPAGDPVGVPLVGKRSTSRSSLARRIEATWNASYAMGFKAYLRRMLRIYDRNDGLDAQLEIVKARQKRMKHRPDAEKALAVDLEFARIRKERRQLKMDRNALIAECRPLPRFLPEPPKPPKNPPELPRKEPKPR